ncbi:MAG: glycosyltransferase, partial [Elusimicrobia bacterium]|nr:glycosyltransferase [Elusimicrobiota bacterium]
MPAFSVILPTYNRARMAQTALKTVLGQTFRDWECLVVDDGSTDDTAAALAAFQDPRVRVLTNEKN